MRKLIPFLMLICIIQVMLPEKILAWYNDPKVNTPLSLKKANQIDHTVMPDGSGGAIVTWAERKLTDPETEFDIYAQRIDSHGDPVWSSPTVICAAPDYQGLPKITRDGAGGAYIVWHDSRLGYNPEYSNFDIYAQHIDKDGHILWEPNGIPICTANNWQVYTYINTNEQGALLIGWDDGRSMDSQVYCQIVDFEGNILWQENGVLVANLPYGQTESRVVSDADGGLIVVWQDYRELGNVDVYAQRIDKYGTRAWGEEGLGIATVCGDQFHSRVVSDGNGGAIFAWADGRNGDYEFDIHAQRVNNNGEYLWPLQGLPICQAPGTQYEVSMVHDGHGGAIISWTDGRNGENTDIYAQRVSAEAAIMWDVDGKAVATTPEIQIQPTLMADNTGGAVITWMDFYRVGTWWNVFAQKISGDGIEQWKKDGVAICVAEDTQADPQIVPSSSDDSIIVWFDGRSHEYYNIYAQQIDQYGLLGGGEYKMITADLKGIPVNTFNTGELIRFESTWVVPAPAESKTYDATALMSINSYTDFMSGTINYEVNSEGVSTPKKFYAWLNDPILNTPIAPKENNQIEYSVLKNSADTYIITWAEQVQDTEFNIYAQKIDSHGKTIWSSPIEICMTTGFQGNPKITTDGLDGAIIAWHDARNTNMAIYAQRINNNGETMWATNGILVSPSTSWQYKPVIASDNANGAIIAWHDGRNDISQIFAQRVNINGEPMWQSGGIQIAHVPNNQSNADISSDGAGGAIIAWSDHPLNTIDIYAQKIDIDGNLLWGNEGLAICTVAGNQFNAKVISDGIGGGIISWSDGRHGEDKLNVYAQRVSSNGFALWGADGTAICTSSGSQFNCSLISDNSGGAIFTWEDSRKGNEDSDIYAQHITALGLIEWTSEGIVIASTEGFQKNPALISDGLGGAYITWQDYYRMGASWNIFAQHIDNNGIVKWLKDGVPVSIADEAQIEPIIVPTGENNSIIFWRDARAGTYVNIYAQQIDKNGLLGGGEFVFYTADIDGTPKSMFKPGELICFKAYWAMSAPLTVGDYEAKSGMIIHSYSNYKEGGVEYNIIEKQ